MAKKITHEETLLSHDRQLMDAPTTYALGLHHGYRMAHHYIYQAQKTIRSTTDPVVRYMPAYEQNKVMLKALGDFINSTASCLAMRPDLPDNSDIQGVEA